MKKKWIFMPTLLLLMFLAFDMQPVQAEVTSYTLYRQKDEELDKYIYSCLFEIDNGEKYAFCIERSKMTPIDGATTSEWIELFNEDLRKVLYYGTKGPADRGYTVVETSCAAAAANGDNDTSIGVKILEEIRALESPPPSFRIWMVETNEGRSQDIAFYTTLTTGDLVLEKVSAEDGGLHLQGAVYGVYEDFECMSQIATLTTDENGLSEPLELNEGTVFLKELTAPEGYELSEEVLEVNVLVERTVTLVVADQKVIPRVDLVVRKQNVIGEGLEGAEFMIYEDATCSVAVASGTTDEDGKLIFPELVEGTTYYLKETKAPEGYILLDDIYEVVPDGEEITVVNEKIFVLPNTGSVHGLLISSFGAWCIIKSRKRRQ